MDQPDFQPTRQCGLERLTAFKPNMGPKYAAERNSDLGKRDRSNVSCLSPWIRHRLITEEEVVQTALDRFKFSTAEKFIQEVCWRTYFKGWLEQRPAVWASYCTTRNEWYAELDTDSGLRDAYTTAIEGRTGIDAFDHWARELPETGYLHNHARMWFASIWIFTLKLPWQLGADFFLQHLIDGDPASNTLSWRWVGGLHTKGKTYLARRSNIETYTDGRFSPDGLADSAPPVEGFDNPSRQPIAGADCVPEEPFLLLLTEEDLHPESLLSEAAPVAAIAGLASPDLRSPAGAGKHAKAFTHEALENTLARAGSHFGVSQHSLAGAANRAEAIATLARDAGVRKVVTPWAPVGWVKPMLKEFADDLDKDGIGLLRIRRDWDEAFWPHATKGFFGLKKKIPDCFDTLGLPA